MFFTGIFVPVRVKTTGLGGALSFACSGCRLRQVSFDSTTNVESSRRSVVSLALHVATFVGGVHHSQIVRTLGQGLGSTRPEQKKLLQYYQVALPCHKGNAGGNVQPSKGHNAA